MRDHGIDLDAPINVPIDDFGHVGAAASAAEGSASPDPAGHQLKWTSRNFLPGPGNADDDALPLAAMAGFERGTHQIHIADAFKRVIGAADLISTRFGHVDEMGNEIAAEFCRIDEMRHAEALAPSFLLRINIDANDHLGADQAEALDDRFHRGRRQCIWRQVRLLRY